MQENTVGWDPVYVIREPGWFLRIYVLYLLLIICLAFARFVQVAWQLWAYRHPASAPFRNLREATRDVMASPITAEGSDKFRLAFNYQCQLCCATVSSIRRSAILTGVYAVATASLGLANILNEVSHRTVSGFSVTAGGLTEAFTSLGIGLVVCTLMYAAAIFLEGRLEHRKIRWDHIFAEKRSGATIAAK